MAARRGLGLGMALLLGVSFCLAASNAELFFATDKNGQNRVTNIQEGTEVWIVVYDPDENIDCDVRDKIWTDLKIMDPKTGAYIVWVSYFDAGGDIDGDPYDELDYEPYKGHFPGNPGWLGADYLEETGADTGLFVSKRAFQVGTREDYKEARLNTHVVDNTFGYLGIDGLPFEFQWGHYEYSDSDFNLPGSTNLSADERGWFGPRPIVPVDWPFNAPGFMGRDNLPAYLPSFAPAAPDGYLLGRFENMDTLTALYVDPNDDTDVATAMMKIIDTEATIAWDQEIYKDANGSASIAVVDADENLNCNAVEHVPVFIIVNPGSWNPVREGSANSFCSLKLSGGVQNLDGDVLDRPIRWYNIYDSGLADLGLDNDQPAADGTYYMEYPVAGEGNVTIFDTAFDFGLCRVMFYAQETGPNTGVFQLNLNSILEDLGFNSLRVRDVLVAYYLDPNDEDDFKLDVAYIEEKMHAITSFTDATRQDQSLYWIGRDPVYVQVIDANANVDPCCPEQVVVFVCDPHGEDDGEWLVLDETSSNSPVFFSNAGTELRPVWDALGIGLAGEAGLGGYQLELDNWKLEVFNEDEVYARYNDVYYVLGEDGLGELGDRDISTAFPPEIDRVRVANDVSFDLMSIADTQVYNGQSTQMWFLDRQGSRVTGYVNADCVFVEVLDPDQNEDILRRERIDAYWDGGQNWPFGPLAINGWDCGPIDQRDHPINVLLGDSDIFNSAPDPVSEGGLPAPKLYVLNPRSGFWAPVDLLETGVSTGDFVSVICIDLVGVYECVPTLGVLPGDMVLAFYQDPSNHSDSAMISLKVGIGGGGTPPSQASTTTFVNALGTAVSSYTDADLVYVKVVDPSHAGATTLAGLSIGTQTYTLAPLAGATNDTFITSGLDLDLVAGASLTATYKDATDPTDTSSDTIPIVASKLEVTNFYAGPSPATGPVTFGYVGSGVAATLSVAVYDLAGQLVWENELANVAKIVWDCSSYANGAYLYTIEATDGTDTFSETGTFFLNR